MIFDTKVSFAEPPCYSEPSDSPSCEPSDLPSSESSDLPSPKSSNLPSSESPHLPPCDRPSVHLSDGTILETDMVIGADGQHSTVRLSFQREVVKPRRTGTIVLSGNVPMRRILEDDVLKSHNIAYSWVYWFGPRRCFMGASSLLMDVAYHLTRSRLSNCGL